MPYYVGLLARTERAARGSSIIVAMSGSSSVQQMDAVRAEAEDTAPAMIGTYHLAGECAAIIAHIALTRMAV